MAPDDFAEALGWGLLVCGISDDPAALRAFVRDLEPLPLKAPGPAPWAKMFMLAGRLSQAWGRRK
jgi:hypothetical protein